MNGNVIVALLCLWSVAGCLSVEPVEQSKPQSRPLHRESRDISLPIDGNDTQSAAIQEPSGPLSLSQALDLALANNPRLKAQSWDIRVAQAGITQAQLLPNPELAVEIEGIGGQGPRSGFKGAETTVTLAQPIQLGGKRQARTEVASYNKELAGWDLEQARLQVRAQTAAAFAEVMAAQDREALAKQQVELSEDLLGTVRKRVQAGKDSPVEQSKAQITLSSSRIDLAQAQQGLTVARVRLAALWAGKPMFTAVTEPNEQIAMPPERESLEGSVESHPYVARWTDEIAKAQAEKKLARAEGVPDVSVLAGLKRYEEDDDNTAVLGLAIPLPIFNRNQGTREQATYRLAKTHQLRQQALIEISATLSESHADLVAAYQQITGLQDQILPAAETAFQGTLTGYTQGKFGYLNVLDAQRTLFEVKKQYIEAQLDYHKARADLEQLIGRPLDKESLRNAKS
jgi:cobalt-zinc-cadmium efflux system outer membrane protein